MKRRQRHLEQRNIIYNRHPARNPIMRIRRHRMRKAVALQAEQLARLYEMGEQQILTNKEVQQYMLSVTAGFQFNAGQG